MSLWSWLNNVPSPADNPGDPHGVTVEGEAIAARGLPFPIPSAWDGWPAEWNTPAFGTQIGINRLTDVAWHAIDVNSSILASMPVYRLVNGEIVDSPSWMTNPDPDIYTSWHEFFKQLVWDYMLGEAFVLPMASYADGWPQRFRVIPPWLINTEMRNGARAYSLGGRDVTADILHIRYQSSIDDAHGHGPLECAGARLTAANLLQRYAHRLAETGGTPHYWLGVERRLNKTEADDLLGQWVESRTANAGYPALLSGGATLNQLQSMNARDMALLELSQFNESRVAVLLGLPPFLAGLPSGAGSDGSLTYQNVSQLFTFHDKASLQPKADAIMSALSGWALPRGQTCELNRDEYSRPSLKERFDAYKIGIEAGILSADEVREMERLHGDGPSASALAGVQANTPSAAPQPAAQQPSEVTANAVEGG